MKVKNDHRSEFSNLSNMKKSGLPTGFEPVTSANTGAMLYQLNYTKLTSLPMCGFVAQLVEHRTGIRGGHGFESR